MKHDEEPSMLRRTYLALSGAGLAAIAGCQEEGELEAPARFEVGAVDAPENATEGERITVAATIENVGERAGNTTVEIRRDGEVVETRRVDLEPNGTATVTLERQVTEAGEWDVEIDTGHASASVTVSIEASEAAEFSVEGVEAPSTVTAGEPFVVRGTVANVGDGAGSAGVSLLVDGETVDETDVPLEAGQEETVRFSTSIESAGTAEVTFDVAGAGSASREITVEEREEAAFRVSGVEGPADVLLDRSNRYGATVENVGELEGTTAVALVVDGQTVAEREVTLGPGESTGVEFSHAFDEAGDREVAVRVDGDEASRTVSASEPEPSRFDVSNVSGPESETETVAVRVTARISNTGQESGVAEVELRIDGEAVDTAAIELDAGEFGDVTLEWSPTGTGEFEYTVATGDDSASDAVEIVESQGPQTAAESARDRLADAAGTIVSTIETEFVDNQGNMASSPWGNLQATLASASDKLDEAEGGLDEYDGDSDALAAEIDALRTLRSALYELGQATGEGASAYTGVASVLGTIESGLSPDRLGGLDEEGTAPYVLDQAETGLAKAKGSVADARSAFDDLDDGWLSDFDDDVGADTGVETAAGDLETALGNLDPYVTRGWQGLAEVPLGPARDELATAVDDCHREITNGFFTDPRDGITVDVSSIDADLRTAGDRLTTAKELVEHIEASDNPAVVEHRNLEHVHSALDSLTSSMQDGAKGINKATDAVAVLDMSETAHDRASGYLDTASDALSDASAAFGAAQTALDRLDQTWADGFEADVTAGDIQYVFSRFDGAIEAGDVLESGIDTLLDISGPVRTANSAYDDEDYETAETEFSEAQSIAGDAYGTLSDGASDVPAEMQGLLDVAACRAGHVRDALGMLADAASLAADGKTQEASQKADDALDVANAECP